MAELKITANNFEKEALQSPLPVLLDFWAPWCGPCRMLAPELKALADEYAGRVVVGKVNVDEEPELAAAFRVASIPTVVVIRDGKVVRTSVGYKPKEALAALLA
ncbi:MAG: thioredoxin [Clostridiales bacterium]|nr:thioredoxin [Clostridiales bacterium]